MGKSSICVIFMAVMHIDIYLSEHKFVLKPTMLA